MHVAAQLAAWAIKLGARGTWQGAYNRGGSSPIYPALPQVLILLSNGSWMNISTDVRYQDRVAITTGRGPTDVRTRAGSCAFKLDNTRVPAPYSPRVPASPNYGLIGRNTQIIVTHRGFIRFWGEIPEWPAEGEKGNLDAWVRISAAGILRRLLAPNAAVLQSASRRTISRTTSGLVGYWSLEDNVGSAFFANSADSTPTSAMVALGSGTVLASVTDNPGSSPLPNLGTAGLLGAVITNNVFASSWRVEVDFKIPVLGAGILCRGPSWVPVSSFIIRYEIWVGNILGLLTDNEVSVRIVFTNGSSSIHRTNILVAAGWHHIGLQMAQSGADITGTLLVDGVAGPTINETSVNIGSVKFVNVNAPSDISTTADALSNSAGHFAVWQPVPANFPNVYFASTGYFGETAGNRIARLCAEENIGFSPVGDMNDTVPMGPQGIAKLIDLFNAAEDADQGIFGESMKLFGLQYVARSSMLNQAPDAWLNYAAPGNIDTVLKPTDSDTRIINDSTVTRTNGGSTQIALTTGPMSTQDPSLGTGGIGRYPEGPTYNLRDDSQTGDLAGWRIHKGTLDKQRFDNISFNVSNIMDNHGNAGIGAQLLRLDLGQLIAVDNPPPWLPPDQIKLIFVGRDEIFDQISHELTANTDMGDSYIVGVLEDPILGRLESDGTLLATSVSTVATTFSTYTTGPQWITPSILAALAPAESWANFDIVVAGEQMTVTNIDNTITDIFGRTVASTWGSPDIGPAYTTSGGAAGDYNVASGVGTMAATSVNVFRSALVDTGVSDHTVQADFALSIANANTASVTQWLLARTTDLSNYYAAKLEVNTSGQVLLSISKRVGGSLLGVTAPITIGTGHVAGDWWRVVLDVQGSTLQCKAWIPATSADPGWQPAVTDTSLTTGTQVGVWYRLESGNTNTLPVTLSTDNLMVTNPQTWTVTRSVNGAVVPHAVGSAVALKNPLVLTI